MDNFRRFIENSCLFWNRSEALVLSIYPYCIPFIIHYPAGSPCQLSGSAIVDSSGTHTAVPGQSVTDAGVVHYQVGGLEIIMMIVVMVILMNMNIMIYNGDIMMIVIYHGDNDRIEEYEGSFSWWGGGGGETS